MARRQQSRNTDSILASPGYFDAVAGAAMAQHVRNNAVLAGADLQRAASRQPTGQADPAWAELGYGNQYIGGGTQTVGNVTYNPNYHNNLLAQGHTRDPYTGAAIPGAQLKGLTAKQMRTVSKAQRDVKALYDLTQGATPQIDMQTAMKAKQAMEREYGVETLIHLPEYRELAGTNEAYEAQKQAAVAAKAQATGRDLWKFDEESGQVVMDREKVILHNLDQEDAKIAQKPILEMRKFQEDMADSRLKQELERAEEMVRLAYTTKDSKGLVDAQNHRDKVRAEHRQELARLRGYSDIESGELEQAASAPATKLTHPKLPANVSIAGSFASPAEMKTSNLGNGSYAIGGPFLFRKDAQGIWQEVK